MRRQHTEREIRSRGLLVIVTTAPWTHHNEQKVGKFSEEKYELI